jgi:tRNA threonylcarbamoyladenosine biosynthesis protein TsaB
LKVLAIDTSQKTVSTAILADNIVRADIFIDNGRHHSEILLPAIEEVFHLAGMEPDDIDLFALTIGPGSFTGLRIGAATMKGFVLSTGKPVLGVSTLDVLALNSGSVGMWMICPMLDAQQNQVYTALYSRTEGMGMEKIRDERIIDADNWLHEIKDSCLSMGANVFFLGDGAVKYRPSILRRFSSSACIAEGHQNHVKASAAAVLARDRFDRGETLDLLTFTPCYLRPPEAETRLRRKTSEIED